MKLFVRLANGVPHLLPLSRLAAPSNTSLDSRPILLHLSSTPILLRFPRLPQRLVPSLRPIVPRILPPVDPYIVAQLFTSVVAA
ncbi:uncharacterized protein G2W53_040354 [Senna tora]|uniref:Uncharacterized protein n=1 Tax=Senna tora TaxID=362788 RepID=A0A834VX72_9FABA|nr:uncharacterized protein G2W53_040354 [Senna tora]